MRRGLILAAVVAVLVGLTNMGNLSQGAASVRDQPGCTVNVQPGESIQAAIDRVPEGAVLCLPTGVWEANIKITKSVTLRRVGADMTVIHGVARDHIMEIPVIWITGPREDLLPQSFGASEG